jgi:hypothetical protein
VIKIMTTTEEKPVSVSTEDVSTGAARQLRGATFLTLEHIGYFMLVVLLPGLFLAGVAAALQLWGARTANSEPVPLGLSNIVTPGVNTAGALALVALLFVAVPLLYCLRRRIGAEYAKRPGYTGRVAYKLPVYTALALLITATLGTFTTMLYVFLSSLALIGVSGANVGEMYLAQFIPALLGFVIFGATAWYVLWFAKGRDMSRLFVQIAGVIGGIMVIALFVTALTVNHDAKNRGNSNDPIQIQPYPTQNNNTYNF